MGEVTSHQPFLDQLIVLNETDDDLKYLDVNYGRFESFWIFDLPPGKRVTLRASPGFGPNGTSNFFVGYGGQTQGGKEFEGKIEKTQRKSPADGALQFEIAITPKDVKH
jgi:hypothetical protein